MEAIVFVDLEYDVRSDIQARPYHYRCLRPGLTRRGVDGVSATGRRVLRLARLGLLLACCLTGAARAATAGAVLPDAARLWSAAKYTHPQLADGRIDWDRALVEAMPALLAAHSRGDTGSAVATLMAPLKDPSLRMHAGAAPELVRWQAGSPELAWLPGGVALLHLHAGIPTPAQIDGLGAARKLILDLRPALPARAEDWEGALHQLVARLVDKPLLLPAERYRVASGPRPADGWEGMPGAFLTLEAERVMPAADARARPMVFIVNDTEPVPKVVLALQRAGLAMIVAEEGAFRIRSGPLQTVSMNGMRVEFSAGELVLPDGRVDLRADRVLNKDRRSGAASAPVRAALALLGNKWRPRARSASPAPAFAVRQEEPAYREMAYPGPAWRSLAAIKLWSVMDRHFPAKRLMSSSWDDALSACLERMSTVQNAFEYGRALEDMAATLDDSHVVVFSRAINLERGKGTLGVGVGLVEGRYLVTSVAHAGVGDGKRLRIGDDVLSLDGENFSARVARLAPRVAASTPAGKIRDAIARALRGAPGSTALLELSGADRETRSVRLPYAVIDEEEPVRGDRPIIDILAGNIAYVDLDRLEPGAVDAMFQTVMNTRTLILDMRGYPHGVGQALLARLNVNGASSGPVSAQNLVTAYDAAKGARLLFSDIIAPARGPLYGGKVIMLIDEHSQSQAEYLAMQLEAATPVQFVGTPSAGANGDIRTVALPGGVFVSYSGYEVSHADGRQFQRIGIVPHVLVAPTVDGLRAGRDDVLERAIRHAQER